jgi:hypothetical protein
VDGTVKQQRFSIRKNTGQAATALNLLMSVFVLLLLGVFAWEMSLYLLAKDQLKTCVEVAALTCETSLCSSGDVTQKPQAITTAYNLFCRNTILGNSLAGTPPPVALPSDLNPAPGEANICFQFLDPVTRSAVNVIGPAGAIIEADGAYCYQPIFGRFLGLSNVTFTVLVSAQAGLPRTDVVVCFDICGVGDDATLVTFVQRFWGYDITPPHIVYSIPWLPENPPTPGQYAFGPLGALGCFPPDSQTTNVLPPRDMAQMQTNPNGLQCPIAWSEVPNPAPGNPNQPARGLMGVALTNPPGNLCFTSPGVPAVSWMPSKNQIAKATTHRKKGAVAQSNHPAKNLQATNLPGAKAIANQVAMWNEPASKYELCSQAALGNSASPLKINFQANPVVHSELADHIRRNAAAASSISKPSGRLDGFLIPPAFATGPPGAGYAVLGNPVGTGNYATLLVAATSLSSGTPINYAAIPPGNTFACNGTTSGVSYVEDPNAPYFTGATDVVQNLDNSYIFQSYGDTGYIYPDLGVLVEAMRGNLESTPAAQAAGVDLAAFAAVGVTPKPGYQNDYISVASLNTQPFNVMRNNLQSLLDMVYRVSDVHFGLVVFNGIVGQDSGTTFLKPKWDTYYTPGGQANYPIPQVFLNPNPGTVASNYTQITNILPSLHVYGKRDTGVALKAALDQLDPANNFCRTWATKAVVFITNGPPTHDSTGAFTPGGTALQDARAQAVRAHNMGVPIYVICVDPIPDNDVNDTPAYDETVSGSICNTAGHGSKYYYVPWPQAVNQTAPNISQVQSSVLGAVGNVARQLNTLLH